MAASTPSRSQSSAASAARAMAASRAMRSSPRGWLSRKSDVGVAPGGGTSDADLDAREVGAGEMPLDVLQAVLAAGGAARTHAHARERQVEVVADHEQVRRGIELVEAHEVRDGEAAVVHVGLRLGEQDFVRGDDAAGEQRLAAALVPSASQAARRADRRCRSRRCGACGRSAAQDCPGPTISFTTILQEKRAARDKGRPLYATPLRITPHGAPLDIVPRERSYLAPSGNQRSLQLSACGPLARNATSVNATRPNGRRGVSWWESRTRRRANRE